MNGIFAWLGALLDLLRKIFLVVSQTKTEVDAIVAHDANVDAQLAAIKAELDEIKQLVSGPPVPPEDIELSGTVDQPVNQKE